MYPFPTEIIRILFMILKLYITSVGNDLFGTTGYKIKTAAVILQAVSTNKFLCLVRSRSGHEPHTVTSIILMFLPYFYTEK